MPLGDDKDLFLSTATRKEKINDERFQPKAVLAPRLHNKEHSQEEHLRIPDEDNEEDIVVETVNVNQDDIRTNSNSNGNNDHPLAEHCTQHQHQPRKVLQRTQVIDPTLRRRNRASNPFSPVLTRKINGQQPPVPPSMDESTSEDGSASLESGNQKPPPPASVTRKIANDPNNRWSALYFVPHPSSYVQEVTVVWEKAMRRPYLPCQTSPDGTTKRGLRKVRQKESRKDYEYSVQPSTFRPSADCLTWTRSEGDLEDQQKNSPRKRQKTTAKGRRETEEDARKERFRHYYDVEYDPRFYKYVDEKIQRRETNKGTDALIGEVKETEVVHKSGSTFLDFPLASIPEDELDNRTLFEVLPDYYSRSRRGQRRQSSTSEPEKVQAQIRIGRNYQAIIPKWDPAIKAAAIAGRPSDEDIDAEDGYFGSDTCFWDPSKAQQARERGEDIDGFISPDNADLTLRMAQLEALHYSNYVVERAKSRLANLLQDSERSRFTDSSADTERLKILLRGQLGRKKKFEKIALKMDCSVETVLVHYYRWKCSSKEYYQMKLTRHEEANDCTICNDGGKLLICDKCHKAFHLSCLDPPLTEEPDGTWYCEDCMRCTPAMVRRLALAPSPRLDTSGQGESATSSAIALSPGRKEKVLMMHKECRVRSKSKASPLRHRGRRLPNGNYAQPGDTPEPDLEWDSVRGVWVSMPSVRSAGESQTTTSTSEPKATVEEKKSLDPPVEAGSPEVIALDDDYDDDDDDDVEESPQDKSDKDAAHLTIDLVDSEPEASDSSFDGSAAVSDGDGDDDDDNLQADVFDKEARQPNKSHQSSTHATAKAIGSGPNVEPKHPPNRRSFRGAHEYTIELPRTDEGLLITVAPNVLTGKGMVFVGYRKKKSGEDGPAERQSLFEGLGDEIIAVEGESCTSMSHGEASQLLKNRAEGQSYVSLRMRHIPIPPNVLGIAPSSPEFARLEASARRALRSPASQSLQPAFRRDVNHEFYVVGIPFADEGLLIQVGERNGRLFFSGYTRSSSGIPGPAELSKVFKGPLEEITKIDNVNCSGLAFAECLRLLKSQLPGSTHKILLVRHKPDPASLSRPLKPGPISYKAVVPFTNEGLLIRVEHIGGRLVFMGYRKFQSGASGPAELQNAFRQIGDEIVEIDNVACVKLSFSQQLSMLQRPENGVSPSKVLTMLHEPSRT